MEYVFSDPEEIYTSWPWLDETHFYFNIGINRPNTKPIEVWFAFHYPISNLRVWLEKLVDNEENNICLDFEDEVGDISFDYDKINENVWIFTVEKEFSTMTRRLITNVNRKQLIKAIYEVVEILKSADYPEEYLKSEKRLEKLPDALISEKVEKYLKEE